MQNLAQDVRSLPTQESLALLAAGSVGAIAVHGADDNLSAWAARATNSSFTTLGRHLGEGWIQAGVAVGTYVAGRVSRNAKTTHIGSDFVRAQVLNALLTQGLKAAVQRKRPSGGPRSFPSGHSSAAFASAAVLHGHFGWKNSLPAFAAAGLVSWTRVRDNSHWMSDVVFGSTLGVLVGHAVTSGHDRSWILVPTATKGGLAIYFIR